MNVRLTDEQRAAIRAAYATGAKQHLLARKYGVTQPCISKIVEGIPKVRVQRPQRRCVDCGTPLRYKRRCMNCLPPWRRTYNQRRYAAITKQEASSR